MRGRCEDLKIKDMGVEMVKLLSIKKETEIKGIQEIGDIVGVFRSDHEFSPNEKIVFEIVEIPNIDMIQAKKIFAGPKIKNVFRMPAANKWSDQLPQQKQVWKDTDGKWYFLAAKPKFMSNISKLSTADKNLLKSATKSKQEKEASFGKVSNRVKDDVLNMVHASDIPIELE